MITTLSAPDRQGRLNRPNVYFPMMGMKDRSGANWKPKFPKIVSLRRRSITPTPRMGTGAGAGKARMKPAQQSNSTSCNCTIGQIQ